MSKEQSIDLDRKQLKLLEKIIDRHVPNKAVWAYGSRVTWKASQTSDLDLVVFDCASTQIFDLKDAFEESDLLISVDVMDWEIIPDNFKENIKKKYLVLQEQLELKNWQTVKIGDVANVVGGGTPSTKKPEYWGGKIPWLTPRDLSNFYGRYISKGERNISKLGLSKSSSKLAPKGAVLLTTRAPVGYLAIAENEVSTNQRFRSLIPNKKTNNLFLFYLLKHNVEYLKSQSSGTTFGELAGSTLKSLSFLFPPPPEQKAIAEVLSSLDDKIDLLHRQNKTLEDMAQTLFRQWFVDEADEDLELSEFVEINPKENLSKGTTAPYLEMKNVQNDSSSPSCWQDRKFVSGSKFKNGDSLLARITPCLENGKSAFVQFLENNDQVGWGSTEFLVLRAKQRFHPFCSYLLAKNEDFKSFAIGSMTGSSGRQRVQTESLFSYILGSPTKNRLQELNKTFEITIQKIQVNAKQIQTLSNLRDTLLPKLMIGKVRV